MFFYLSFLRPPPVQASPSGSILITPQVANDLRTEPFPDAQEIFYSWSFCPLDQPSTFPAITKPQKLTVWRQSSAYKEISVPLPPGVREGQSYRLVLTTHGQGIPHVINFASAMIGEKPFPVVSMPIIFSSRKVGGTMLGKQEQIERIYRIPLNVSENAFLVVKEQTSFDLDKKIWDSGIGLSSWIVNLSNSPSEINESGVITRLKEILFSSEPRNYLELGAGTGIVSLTLGALRSSLKAYEEGCIITTDLDSAMPLLGDNITTNAALFRTPPSRPQAVTLDWDEVHLPDEVVAVRQGFDLVMMADVTYNTDSFPSLIRTLSNVVHLHRDPTLPNATPQLPLILLGYKQRDPAERTLWDMAREYGITFDRVGDVCGAGGEPIEGGLTIYPQVLLVVTRTISRLVDVSVSDIKGHASTEATLFWQQLDHRQEFTDPDIPSWPPSRRADNANPQVEKDGGMSTTAQHEQLASSSGTCEI
ncbi:hypothetical protein A0H81_13122 [Grifola frondosa]|uniref:Uncharacterized protein n=1 Tax=Grifola frondosa TaxID=5627 RepID=A0A1C7LQ57_GRIFR|nr:hypothetical protein A0H81_13122 [Grifola frondosa]